MSLLDRFCQEEEYKLRSYNHYVALFFVESRYVVPPSQ